MSPRTDIILSPAPASLFAPTPKAAQRVLEFFTTQINNDHTRKSYLNATRRFAEWCELHRLHQLADVQPFHVAAFVKDLQGHFSTPTVKQHLSFRCCENDRFRSNPAPPSLPRKKMLRNFVAFL